MHQHRSTRLLLVLAMLAASVWLSIASMGCAPRASVLEETYTRQVGLKFCSCHDAEGEDVKTKALAIFNLRQQGWIKGLSEELLDAFIERNKKGTSQDTQALSQELVAAERQRRKDQDTP